MKRSTSHIADITEYEVCEKMSAAINRGDFPLALHIGDRWTNRNVPQSMQLCALMALAASLNDQLGIAFAWRIYRAREYFGRRVPPHMIGSVHAKYLLEHTRRKDMSSAQLESTLEDLKILFSYSRAHQTYLETVVKPLAYYQIGNVYMALSQLEKANRLLATYDPSSGLWPQVCELYDVKIAALRSTFDRQPAKTYMQDPSINQQLRKRAKRIAQFGSIGNWWDDMRNTQIVAPPIAASAHW